MGTSLRGVRIETSNSLPQLLGRVGRRYAQDALARGIRLDFEIDPALAGDLQGPFPALGRALSLLLEHALHTRGRHVALHVDVVGDDAGTQIVHFTVADEHQSRGGRPRMPRRGGGNDRRRRRRGPS